MTYVRFLANDDVRTVVDGEPGPGEVGRGQADAWKAAGVPMEFFEKGAENAPPPASARGDKRRRPA